MSVEEWGGQEREISIPLTKWMSKDGAGHEYPIEIYDGTHGKWKVNLPRSDWQQLWAGMQEAYPEVVEEFGSSTQFIRAVIGSVTAGMLNDPKIIEAAFGEKLEEIRLQELYRNRDERKTRLRLNLRACRDEMMKADEQRRLCAVILRDFEESQIVETVGRKEYDHFMDHVASLYEGEDE